MKQKIDYIKAMFQDREQTRYDTTNTDDAATLLMSLMELEWRYHHLAMLKYRNHKHKDFHNYWGMYWATKSAINIIFPWFESGESFSRRLCELNRMIDVEDAEMLRGSAP
jgi:hypothetical protein